MDSPRLTHLKTLQEGPIHISHFMDLVSAYVVCKEQIELLGQQLQEAIESAKKTRQSQIVSQDCNDFFFVVHPAGTLDLCCRMRSYVVVDPQTGE